MDDRLRAVFARQSEELPEATQRALVLLAASEVDLLGPVVAALDRFVGDPHALDAAEDAGLLSVAGNRVRFRHPLVRSAVYHGASAGLRRAAHTALGDVLRPDQPERAAWHRALATAVPDESVAAELVATAVLARRRGGHAAEARALERA